MERPMHSPSHKVGIDGRGDSGVPSGAGVAPPTKPRLHSGLVGCTRPREEATSIVAADGAFQFPIPVC